LGKTISQPNTRHEDSLEAGPARRIERSAWPVCFGEARNRHPIATCKKADWHLVPQLATKIRGRQVRPDGTLRDDFNLHRGYWEAKGSGDKLDAEIRKKIALGYPLSNTIFEDTATAKMHGTEIFAPSS